MRFFSKSNRYYGDTDWINLIVSKLVFGTINHRRNMLLRRYGKHDPETAIDSNKSLGEDLERYLSRGLDKLNIGGGSKNLEGYLNADFVRHNSVESQLVADVLDLSFIPNESIPQVHSCHFIEHLSRDQIRYQFLAYHRILRKGGRVSVRCPNALGVCYGFFFEPYPEENHEEFLTYGYPADEAFYDSRDGWYSKDLYGLYHWLWAFTGHKLNQHLIQLTPTELRKLFEKCGFVIRCASVPEASNLVMIVEKF